MVMVVSEVAVKVVNFVFHELLIPPGNHRLGVREIACSTEFLKAINQS